MSFLSAYFDPALDVPSGGTHETFNADEVDRLSELLAIALTAAAIPRRIGDATDEQLQQDKKRAKRVAHAVDQVLTAWNGSKPDVLPDSDVIRQRAAQMEWSVWWSEHQVWLTNRTRYAVTWGRKTGQPDKWIKSSVVRLQNEERWIQYALRE